MRNEKIKFNIPGISEEEMEKAREQGQKEIKAKNEKPNNETGLKGKTLHDILKLKTSTEEEGGA